jgi:hypothetical protein
MARKQIACDRSDGAAWHLLGAALLTYGDWGAGYAQWRVGVKEAPYHSLLRSQCEKDILYDKDSDYYVITM